MLEQQHRGVSVAKIVKADERQFLAAQKFQEGVAEKRRIMRRSIVISPDIIELLI